ncbi:MAG: hypothetical protein DRN27_07500 [Thermoplasmata archaeon]|nr:MAG: hypothetical protein DRN27_07500 [Thermoplasmata archaeon]
MSLSKTKVLSVLIMVFFIEISFMPIMNSNEQISILNSGNILNNIDGGEKSGVWVYVEPSSLSVPIYNNFTLDIYCEPSQAIKSFECSIAYDPDILSVDLVVEGDIFNGYDTFFNNGIIDNDKGEISNIFNLIIGSGNVTEAGSLIKINFSTKNNSGYSDINFSSINVTNENEYIPVSISNGIVIVHNISSDIALFSDWNLITIPIDNNWWASDISDNISGCLSVGYWDYVNQTHKTYIVGGPSAFDFPIEEGYGYFVNMVQSDILSVYGSRIDNVSIPLNIGWNLIGWFHEVDTTASSLSENIPGCLSVSKWDCVNQTYKTFIVGGPPAFDFPVFQGMGLFVDVDESSIWYGES